MRKGGLGETLQALQSLRPRHREPPDEVIETDKHGSQSRLVVVSNRLPFSVKPGDAGYQFLMSSGGLVSAMLGVIDDDAMTWLGWPGIAADDDMEQATIRSQLAEHKCVPVFLDQHTADGYYNGFCNSVLWPLFHYVQDVLDTNPLQVQWDAYRAANRAFYEEIVRKAVCTQLITTAASAHSTCASAAHSPVFCPRPCAARHTGAQMQLVRPGDTVWIHDYHLMLLPTMLKSAMPSLRVGWFLHTPFPTSEVFRMLPMRDVRPPPHHATHGVLQLL